MKFVDVRMIDYREKKKGSSFSEAEEKEEE
jgi:hypothetical protein